jgi:hypothetical protein
VNGGRCGGSEFSAGGHADENGRDDEDERREDAHR